MNIGVDLRALTTSTTSGVTVYLYSVLTELLKLDKKNTYYLWWNSADKSSQPPVFKSPRSKTITTHYSNRLLNLLLKSGYIELDRLILETAGESSKKLDLFWLPDPRPVHISMNCALVSTIHDLAAHTHPEFFNLKTRLWHYFSNTQAITKKSDHLLAVSHFTADEIKNKWHVNAKKITVTSLGVTQNLKRIKTKSVRDKVRIKYQLPKRFVLSLSTLEPRKNLSTLIKAFATLKAETDLPHHLVIAGTANPSIFADPKIKQAPWLHLSGHIDETDKAALFSMADCFCFPSYYEGFGLPALEALATDTPLLAADIPALHEVAGNAAKYAPPDNPDAWAVSLQKTITSHNLNKTGSRQAHKYTWQNTALKTLKIFEKVITIRKKFITKKLTKG